ncbi:MAG: replication initiator protein [Microviridae sp.]|nr:MAG: replication initiator protein [Microviridae sp.]
MPCFHPVEMWVHNEKKTDNGKRLVIHSYNHRLCADARLVLRKCGQCSGCRLQRSAEWATRCMHEASLYKDNCLITLTYSNDHLPADGSLNKHHIQKFLKRLRKKYGPNIRYYYCGEYGEKFGRPHYHLCLFNFDFKDKTFWRKTDQGFPAYRSASLETLWPFGQSEIGSVTFESAAYVARYIMKKVLGKDAAAHYERHTDSGIVYTIQPEYTDMSRRPGIASAWFDKFHSDVFPHDYCVINGRKIPPPKYYSNRFELLDPLEMEQIKFARQDNALLHIDNNTPERLIIREQVHFAKLNRLTRTLD